MLHVKQFETPFPHLITSNRIHSFILVICKYRVPFLVHLICIQNFHNFSTTSVFDIPEKDELKTFIVRIGAFNALVNKFTQDLKRWYLLFLNMKTCASNALR